MCCFGRPVREERQARRGDIRVAGAGMAIPEPPGARGPQRLFLWSSSPVPQRVEAVLRCTSCGCRAQETRAALRRLSAIDLAAVSDQQHQHQDNSILDRIDNTVVTDANAIL